MTRTDFFNLSSSTGSEGRAFDLFLFDGWLFLATSISRMALRYLELKKLILSSDS